jgi:hypothetical protein
MNRNGEGAGPETGAPGNVLAGDCWGILSLSDHRAQRLAGRHKVRPALAGTVAALAWREAAS